MTQLSTPLLTPHLQYVPGWFPEFVERCKGKLRTVKGVNVYPNVPGVLTLGRHHVPEEEANPLVMQGAAGVPAWIALNVRDMDEYPHVYAWQGPNEFLVDHPDKVEPFIAFYRELMEQMWKLGEAKRGKPYKVMVGNTNAGWYRLLRYQNVDPEPYAFRLVPLIEHVNRLGGIWSFHEYDWPTMWETVDKAADGTVIGGPRVLRHRYTQQEWEEYGAPHLNEVYIGECSVDSVMAGIFPHKSWQDIMSASAFMEQLAWYNNELAREDNVLGASIFTVCNWDWFSFDITEELAMMLADAIGNSTGVAPEPIDPEPIDPEPLPEGLARGCYLSKYQDRVTRESLQALWDSGQRAIGFRVTGPDDYDNPTYTEIDKIFTAWYPIVREMGFLTYGFAYVHPKLNGQAAVFAQAVAGKTFELGLWGDVEHPDLDANRCERFFTAADRETGEVVHVYGRKNQLDPWRVSDNGLWQEGRKLWLGAWTDDLNDLPDLPLTWETTGWEWWQWTHGELPGIDPPEVICLDVWRGTTAQLLEEYGQEEPVTGPEIDERIASFLTITQADAGAKYRLKSVVWMNEEEAAGLHHIFVDVVDTDGNRLVGETVRVYWADGHQDLLIEEKPGEPWAANFAMYAVLGSYGAFGGSDVDNSDAIDGMGLGTPEQPNFTIHTCFGVTFIVGAEDPEDPEPEDPTLDHDVEIVDTAGVPLENLTWEDVQTEFRMSVIRATPPAGAQVYRLRRLMLIETDIPLLRVFTVNEQGQPVPGCLAFMGWEDGTDLPLDCRPHIAEGVWQQPEGRPNKALVYGDFADNQTNVSGYVEWIWSNDGQSYDPAETKGPHWSWIRAGDAIYTDVIDGEGIPNGEFMFWPIFVLETEPGEPEEPIEGDVIKLLTALVEQTTRIADAVEVIAGTGSN